MKKVIYTLLSIFYRFLIVAQKEIKDKKSNLWEMTETDTFL